MYTHACSLLRIYIYIYIYTHTYICIYTYIYMYMRERERCMPSGIFREHHNGSQLVRRSRFLFGSDLCVPCRARLYTPWSVPDVHDARSCRLAVETAYAHMKVVNILCKWFTRLFLVHKSAPWAQIKTTIGPMFSISLHARFKAFQDLLCKNTCITDSWRQEHSKGPYVITYLCPIDCRGAWSERVPASMRV